MGFFGFGERKVVDLGERYRKQQEKTKTEMPADAGDANILSLMGVGKTPGSSGDFNLDDSASERRKKLLKRLTDMTQRLDDLSSQVYHLQQRIELLERKVGVKTSS